ncbi:MAG: acyl carrier protein [Bacilli bacterium]|nr:acyl carrier protein [Bacilli bacterium]
MVEQQIEEIRAKFAKKIKVETIKDETQLKDLGCDSLDVVELCMDLEDQYQIQFSTDELSSFVTVGDMLNAVRAKLTK